jgi:hypothetical protein
MAVRPVISRIRPALAVAVGIAASAAADPAAAAVTVGSALGARANLVTTCRSPAGCTATAEALGGRAVAVGEDGVIVRWRLRSASRGTAALRVLRPAPGGAFGGVRAGPPRRLAIQARAGRDARYVFAARIPVERGDLLAVDLARGPAAVFHLRSGPGYAALSFEPALAGSEPRAPTRALDGAELLLNADVEPDADGDGFGDETQDNCPSIPNDQTTNPCPSTALPPPGTVDGPGAARPSRTTRFRRHKPVPRAAARAVR